MPLLTWRTAMRAAPVAVEVARRLDRHLRPHVLAYQLARSIDGYVASWTAGDGTHWVVFPDRGGAPLRAFPELSDRELSTVQRRIDRTTLRSHRDLPEGLVRQRAERAAALPSRLRRRDDE